METIIAMAVLAVVLAVPIAYYVLQDSPVGKKIAERVYALAGVLAGLAVAALLVEFSRTVLGYFKNIALLLLLVAADAPSWTWAASVLFVVFWIVVRRNRRRQEIIIALLSEIQRKLE